MDYGHDLLFGVFITPTNNPASDPIGLSVLAEQAGLDLATFQDHPYQPTFYDTWTLMSYVGARTERIRLSANVLNLPLRPPVGIARSAASLDRLTGGRIELGLGAGAFWDAIEASGGRRLSPRQAVEALAEAITIIREVWAVERPGGVRVDGEYYSVSGAKRGPAPAHDIAIWLGAYKPLMLGLTGRSADGWLPSVGYLPGGVADLADMNSRIDDSALDAGREPTAIRRLLNISDQRPSSSQWAQELADIALQYGTSGFILGTDDPILIDRFAAEVAPAVRELVATERSSQPLAVRTAPDDDIRLPVSSRWDETTRPSGPPPPQDHDYPAGASAVGQHLVEVHDMLREELERVREITQQVLSGAMAVGEARSSINEMTMRQNDWTLGAYCAAYCRTVTMHHSMEDAQVFPYLRRSDSGLAPVIDRLAQEHVVIHDVLEELDAALVRFIADPENSEELHDAVDALTNTLLSHLAYEERELVEPLSRLGFYAGQV